MIKYITRFIILSLTFALNSSIAQEGSIGLLAKVSENKIHLKVIPKTAHYWLKGIEHGYVIYRREIGQSEFEPISDDVLRSADEATWLQAEKGEEMYKFHQESVSKISAMISGGDSFLTSFRELQRADENFKLYIIMTMRDEEFGDYVGLETVDMTADPGKLYEYKVLMKGADIESDPVIFDSNKELKSPPLTALSQDRSVRLSWIHDESLPLLAYYLERSVTGTQYDRITEGPIWPTVNDASDTLDINRVYEIWHQDSIKTNYQPHFYRLVALDAWGDEWKPSNPIKEMGVDQTPPRIGNVYVETDTINRNFRIKWDPSTDTDVHSYFITSADNTQGQDTVIEQGILPFGMNNYVFENPIEMKNYYFKVGVVDTSGNYSLSKPVGVFINDITPPALESNIIHEVDSTGVVNLSWPRMTDHNPKGYWVFKSFDSEGDFMKITDTVITENHLVDPNSLSLLNHEVYYYITAIDESFNESEPTEVLKVVLPDTIPPSATYITGVSRVDNLMEITWDKNQSNDVASYQLYKKIADGEWILMGTVSESSTDFQYEESAHQPINYKIVALDDSGNKARSQPVFTYVPQPSELAKFDLKLSMGESDVSISWSAIGKKYKLYMGVDDKFHMLKYLDANSYKISNKQLADGSSFYVKAYDSKGKLVSISQSKKL